MFHLTQEQASILIVDFSYLDKRQNETVETQLEYMKQKPWQSTILHINGSCFVKMHWDFRDEGFFLSGLDNDKEVYYEHLEILDEVIASEIPLVNDRIEWGIDPEVFAEIYSQRMVNNI